MKLNGSAHCAIPTEMKAKKKCVYSWHFGDKMTKLNYLLGQITNQFVNINNNKYEYEDVIRGFRFYDVDLLRPYAKDLINEEMYTSNPALMIRINPVLPIFVSIGKGCEG